MEDKLATERAFYFALHVTYVSYFTIIPINLNVFFNCNVIHL